MRVRLPPRGFISPRSNMINADKARRIHSEKRVVIAQKAKEAKLKAEAVAPMSKLDQVIDAANAAVEKVLKDKKSVEKSVDLLVRHYNLSREEVDQLVSYFSKHGYRVSKHKWVDDCGGPPIDHEEELRDYMVLSW